MCVKLILYVLNRFLSLSLTIDISDLRLVERVLIMDYSSYTVSVPVGPTFAAASSGGGKSGEGTGLQWPALADSVFGRVDNITNLHFSNLI